MAAHRCGWRPADFWAATPWQLHTVIRADADRMTAERDLAIITAWHTEAFARTKRLPDLAKLLKPKPTPAALSARLRHALLTMRPEGEA